MEALCFLKSVGGHFQDGTRHWSWSWTPPDRMPAELPVSVIYQIFEALQPELTTTYCLLAEVDIGDVYDRQVLPLLSLRNTAMQRGLHAPEELYIGTGAENA